MLMSCELGTSAVVAHPAEAVALEGDTHVSNQMIAQPWLRVNAQPVIGSQR